jgi:hypothetical protein
MLYDFQYNPLKLKENILARAEERRGISGFPLASTIVGL